MPVFGSLPALWCSSSQDSARRTSKSTPGWGRADGSVAPLCASREFQSVFAMKLRTLWRMREQAHAPEWRRQNLRNISVFQICSSAKCSRRAACLQGACAGCLPDEGRFCRCRAVSGHDMCRIRWQQRPRRFRAPRGKARRRFPGRCRIFPS